MLCAFIFSLLICLHTTLRETQVRKSPLAIVQYATDRQYLCNALINVERLVKFRSKANLVVLLPQSFLTARTGSPINRITNALRQHQVILHGLNLDTDRLQDITYAHSLQKLEILKLDYDRVIYFDNDGLVLRNLDDLAKIDGSQDLVLPEAYYSDHVSSGLPKVLSSAFMLIKPSLQLYNIAQAFVQKRSDREFDMEIINKIARSSDVQSSVLPYRKHLLLTGIFRDHSSYLPDSMWDAQTEYDEAYYIHFSDAPIPKPWVDDRGASLAKHGPRCPVDNPGCDEVRIWKEIYKTFRDEMRELCPTTKELDP